MTDHDHDNERPEPIYEPKWVRDAEYARDIQDLLDAGRCLECRDVLESDGRCSGCAASAGEP